MFNRFLKSFRKLSGKNFRKFHIHRDEALASEIRSLQWAIENSTNFIENILKAYPSPFLLKHLQNVASASVLDVGSGPVSYMLNYVRQNSNRFKLTSIDALADAYAEMMRQYGYDVPRNIAGYAEDLDVMFPRKTFDIIFCSNSIDHAVDITKSVEKMSLVLKDEGFIYILCNIDEKERNKGTGMHYHNVALTDNHLTDDGEPILIPDLKICDHNIYTQTWTVGDQRFEAPRFEVIVRKTK